MNIDPNKVIDAIAALKAAADAMILGTMEPEKIATECLEAAAALQASVQIAGVTHRTFHTTGRLQ